MYSSITLDLLYIHILSSECGIQKTDGYYSIYRDFDEIT